MTSVYVAFHDDPFLNNDVEEYSNNNLNHGQHMPVTSVSIGMQGTFPRFSKMQGSFRIFSMQGP